MSTVEVNKIEGDIFPLNGREEIQSVHFKALRERLWVLEHPYAGNIDTTIEYGKWVGDDTNFLFVDYDIHNWAGWNPDTEYHPGFPIVKYKWGSGVEQVDIFVFKGTADGDIVSANPPVVGGKLNGLWLLTVDPNKYSHWNFNAGRPDIDATDRWIISQHGWDDPAFGGEGWLYGLWKAYQELPADTDPYEQIPYIKKSGLLKARHKPLEQERDHISTKLQTQRRRMFQDGYVGIIPNHTWWYDHFFPDMVSEYIRLNGDPIDSIQWGPDYREPKKNSSHQDRIQHAIEQNYQYAVEVDDDWIKAFQYWYIYGQEIDSSHDEGCVGAVYNRVYGGYSNASGWVYGGPPYPDLGDVVWHNNYFWLCLLGGGEWYEPGTDEEHWAQKEDGTADLLYQPSYVSTHPLYVQFSDPLFYCNSSAFEKVLKIIGKYDWYWDDKFPAVDWWMYQKHYYLMTLHLADPDAGHEQEALKRWPKPRGCWRRIWRHTQNWDKARNQKGRFGKEINIDGKMVAMMWPGEMGTPPGYDQQFVPSKALLEYRGLNPAFNFDDLTYQQIISEAQYNAMDATTFDSWPLFKAHYTTIDVEELFRQAYKNSIWPERRIAERHDPQVTNWILVYNESTGKMEPEEVPVFEIHHDLVNDMRDALLQLKFLRNPKSKTVKHMVEYTHKQDYPSGIAAYQAGKQLELYDEFGTTQHSVGYMGFVCWYVEPHYEYSPWDETLPGQSCWRNNSEVTLVSDKQDIPGNIVGAAMIRVLYRIYGVHSLFHIVEGCVVGFKDIILEDNRTPLSDPLPWKAAYIGLESTDFKWEYNDITEKWEYHCSYVTKLIDDWPPEAYFDGTYTDAEWRIWSRQLELKWNIDNDCIFQIDFDGYSDVFARDETNFIEV